MSDLGPDNWNNAPDAFDPVSEIRVYLNTIAGSVSGWGMLVKDNYNFWQPKIATVSDEIQAALAAAPDGSVFLGNNGKAAYLKAIGDYQNLKDRLTLSSDLYLTAFDKSLTDPTSILGPGGVLDLGGYLDKLTAGLRLGLSAVGGVTGVAIGLIVLYLLYKSYRVTK